MSRVYLGFYEKDVPVGLPGPDGKKATRKAVFAIVSAGNGNEVHEEAGKEVLASRAYAAHLKKLEKEKAKAADAAEFAAWKAANTFKPAKKPAKEKKDESSL